MDRTNPIVEFQAKLAYDLMEYDGPGEKPAWVEHGNATKQDDARRIALVELEERGMDIAPPRAKRQPIPISWAERIAKEKGYDQVIILGRRTDGDEEDAGDHLTTYGINPTHCGVAGRIGNTFKRWMGWMDAEGNGPEAKP